MHFGNSKKQFMYVFLTWFRQP